MVTFEARVESCTNWTTLAEALSHRSIAFRTAVCSENPDANV
jgi:hypothetical protein